MNIELKFTNKELKNDPEAQEWLSQCGRVINQELDRMELDLMTFGYTTLGETHEKCRDKEKV